MKFIKDEAFYLDTELIENAANEAFKVPHQFLYLRIDT